jgi:hypothetical protein
MKSATGLGPVALVGAGGALVCLALLAQGAAADPAVTILSPAEGATIPLNWTLVETEATDFVLDPAAIGQPSVAGRGHQHFFVDGVYLFYGGETSTLLKDLTPGPHTVRVALHNNDHTPISPATWAEVNVTVEGKRSEVHITGPAEGAIVWGDTVTLSVAVANFTIDPGAVGSPPVQGRGHFHVFVDDEYKFFATTTTVNVSGIAPGNHRIRAVLYNNDHTPIALPVSDEVLVHAAALPTVEAQVPTDQKGADVTITVVVHDLVLDQAAVGQASVAGHGNYQVSVDGAYHGTGTNGSYEVSGLSTGEHHIRVTLHNNDHSPIPGALAANVTYTVERADTPMPGAGAAVVALAVVATAAAASARWRRRTP